MDPRVYTKITLDSPTLLNSSCLLPNEYTTFIRFQKGKNELKGRSPPDSMHLGRSASPPPLLRVIRGVLDFSVIDRSLNQPRRADRAARPIRDARGRALALRRRETLASVMFRVASEVGESALVTIALWDYSE